MKTNNLPLEFLAKLDLCFPEKKDQILESFSIETKNPTFRINKLKTTEDQIETLLNTLNLEWKKSDFLPWAYEYVWKERDIWDTFDYKNGHIYMQSFSSQIPVLVLAPEKWDKILDMTAAPGWKTSQIASEINNEWEIVACELSKIRFEKMVANLEKQGSTSVQCIKMDAVKLWEHYGRPVFDKILLDAPCSGEGRFNLNKEKTFSYWTPAFVKQSSNTQKALLKTAYELLIPGGRLVYSTCTISPEENEAMVHMMLSCFPDLSLEEIKLDIPDSIEGLTKYGSTVYRKELSKTKRILPKDWKEGFFIASFVKDTL